MVRNTIALLKLIINPFHATDLFWYPLKTSENLCFSDVFRGYQKRSVAWNGLRYYGNFKISEQIYFLRSYENTEILVNLKTDSNKDLPVPISEKIQTLTKYFGTFSSVILVSFHLNWKRTRSLSLQTECTRYLKSCQTT